MTTATAASGAAQAAPPESILVQYREKKATGMLTSGLMVVAGLPKSSKSTLAASAPESYMLELDEGDSDRIAGRIHDIKEQTDADGNVVVSKLNVFRRVYRAVLQDPSIKVVGIDTFGTLQELIAQEIAEAHGLSSITERKEGVNGYALWDEFNARIDGLIGSFKTCGKLVVCICHSKDPELDEDKKVVIPAGIKAYKQASAKLCARADLIGYTYKKQVGESTEYRLTFQGGPLGIWGSRVDELNDKTIKLPKANPWGALVAAAAAAPQDKTVKPAQLAPEKTEGAKPSKRR